jgi:hypothetical protein
MSRRIFQLRRTLKVDTQEMRLKTMKKLQALFNLSSAFAKGNVRFQSEDGKAKKLDINQRQMWARVAAYIAQVMNSVSLAFDEKEIDRDLDELERLVNEAKAMAQNDGSRQGDSGAEEAISPKGFG